MRLIDADELKEYVRKIGFYCDTEADKEYTIEQIDTLFSTVEAVPIEWIVNWLKRRDGHYCYVDLMIEDWRKENE